MKLSTAEAIGEIRKYARVIKAFEHLEAVADTLAKADQLLKERADQLGLVNGNIEKAHVSLNDLNERVLAQSEQLEDAAQQAQGERDTLISKATADAEAIVAEARTELGTLSEEHQQAAIELRALREKITSTQGKYDELGSKLATAREEARKILEGGA